MHSEDMIVNNCWEFIVYERKHEHFLSFDFFFYVGMHYTHDYNVFQCYNTLNMAA